MSEQDEFPTHPHTGLTAIGFRRNGDPIWPVMGAADDDDDTSDDDVDADTDPADDDKPDEEDKPLGQAGEKALAAEKEKRKAARTAQRAAETERDALKAEVEKLRKGDKIDDKAPDADEIRKQAKTDAEAAVLRERALDKVEAKAAKLFADPEDARALLASNADEFIDGGKIDLDAIKEALEDLLKKKPHLAATAGQQRFNGSADGGARKGSGKPAQLTEQDVKRMSPQQIVDARAKGQLDDYMNS